LREIRREVELDTSFASIFIYNNFYKLSLRCEILVGDLGEMEDIKRGNAVRGATIYERAEQVSAIY
jgi:hypothetical protein